MSLAINKVVLAGASGNLGPAILEQLLAAKFAVTVLTRAGSSHSFPPAVNVATVDYSAPETLSAALEGCDAVVSALPAAVLDTQYALIDAAIAAGVKRFIPSEFGSDTTNPKASQLPVFAGKVKMQRYLAEKAEKTSFTYTLVINGAFFDWGLKVPFIVDLAGHKADLFDGGDQVFSATTLASVGQAVVGVLEHPQETANRAVFVRNANITQNQIIKIAGGEWETKSVDTAALEKAALEELQKSSPNMGLVAINCIKRSLWGTGYGGGFDKAKVDNTLLGVEEYTPAQVEAIIKSAMK